jgi:lipoprotein-anchoring transpeptidase ErfK/SrfK
MVTTLLLSTFLATATPAAPAARPAGGTVSLAASTKKRILVVRLDGKDVLQYDVAVGSPKHPTPGGRFTVRHIVWNPAWVPPKEKWAKGKKPAPPGHPKNPMKVVKIFFREPDYYIHGTDDEESIGEAASHGCIRMTQADAFALGKYLMEQTGLKKSDDWYLSVLSRGKPADVRLPAGVPMVIGP